MNIADDLIKAFNDGYKQGKIDAVVHGQLIDKGAWHTECGKCGYVFETICMVKNYCPNCGAKLESEDKDE